MGQSPFGVPNRMVWTALIAWPIFGETLGPVALVGMALTAAGVALASRAAAR